MNLTHYMLPAHATVFLATIPYVLGIIITSYAGKRALRKSANVDAQEKVWHKLKVTLAVLTALYFVAALALTLYDFTGAVLMHVLLVFTLAISLPLFMFMPFIFINEEKANKNINTYVPNIFMITAVLILGASFVTGVYSSQDSYGHHGNTVAEKVNGQTVEYQRALEPAADGKYLTINAIKQNNGIPRMPRVETITYYTWLERDTDNSIKTVTVNVGEKGGVTIVDDLSADETPYVTYTPMYYTIASKTDSENLCVGGRDKDCDLNATYAYDKATVHIPSGSTSNLVVTNREAEK